MAEGRRGKLEGSGSGSNRNRTRESYLDFTEPQQELGQSLWLQGVVRLDFLSSIDKVEESAEKLSSSIDLDLMGLVSNWVRVRRPGETVRLNRFEEGPHSSACGPQNPESSIIR